MGFLSNFVGNLRMPDWPKLRQPKRISGITIGKKCSDSDAILQASRSSSRSSTSPESATTASPVDEKPKTARSTYEHECIVKWDPDE